MQEAEVLVFLTLCTFLLKKVNPFLILAPEDMAQPPYRVGCDLHGAGMSLIVSSHGIWGPQRCGTTIFRNPRHWCGSGQRTWPMQPAGSGSLQSRSKQIVWKTALIPETEQFVTHDCLETYEEWELHKSLALSIEELQNEFHEL